MIRLIFGNKNGEFFGEFLGGSREENLLLKSPSFDLPSIDSIDGIQKLGETGRFHIKIQEELKVVVSENCHYDLGYSLEKVFLELKEKLKLKEGDTVDAVVNWVELNYSQEEILEVMIKNPLNPKEGNWSNMVTIYDSKYDTDSIDSDETESIECQFEKFIIDSHVYGVESIIAKFNITSSSYYEDEDGNIEEKNESRIIGFDIYGSEMIPANHIICDYAFEEAISNIAKITGRKYTFHSYGEPCFTITKDRTIFWTERKK